MTAAVPHAIAALADPQQRPAARDQLLRLGAAAVEPLLQAGEAPGNPERRRVIGWLLVELADLRAASWFRAALGSDDPQLRAAGACGLARVNSEDAIDALVATIDDAPDPLHSDVTPSATSLATLGRRALPAVLRLLESPHERTRQRAQRVLAQITFEEIERRVRPRPLADAARVTWRDLWVRNGSYRWDAADADRHASVQRWRTWLGASLAERDAPDRTDSKEI